MSDNKKKSSKARQISSKAPPQIANFFSKPLSPNNEQSSSSSPPPSSSSSSSSSLIDRKRKLSEQGATSQNENSNTYAETLQKDAVKISKVQKSKKVSTMVSTFFQPTSPDELSDLFESPHKRMQFKPPPAMPKKKVTRKRKQPTKSNKTKNALETELFEKVLIHHSSADGLNSDELQMALALSRSLTDTHSSNGDSCNISSIIRNAEPFEKEDIVRQTLQKFGFKKRGSNEYDYRDFFANVGPKKKWFSKFTPLTRRSEYMQKEKFKNKVKNILKLSETKESVDCEVRQEYDITSTYLQQFFIPRSPSYHLSLADTDTSAEHFYVNDLVPVSTLRCGCLLKNWANIPGRDVSPQRTTPESSNVDDTTISSEIHNETTSSAIVDGKEDEQINSPNPELINVDDGTELAERQEIVNSSHYGQQLANLSNHSLDADGDNLTTNNLTNERQLFSPDMFADYESSPNNSVTDDALHDQNVGVCSNTQKDSHSGSPIVAHQGKDAIVLSSDEYDEGSGKIISEPTSSVISQQKSIAVPFIATVAKHLSFTERLELYNSDLVLDLSDDDPMSAPADDDPMCAHADDNLMDQLSQDSIVISDDEINYSLNRGVRDKEHSFTKHHTMDMNSQESIVLSDSDDQMELPEDENEERQSFASIEMDNENEASANHSLNDDDLINLSVRELCEKDFVSSAVLTSVKCPTVSNVHSQESIALSDCEDEVEKRQSFASIELDNENGTASDKSLDINIDDEIFNSNHSLNDEDLVNLSVREMCQKEFVSGSAKASTSKGFSRTTSDMTFEKKLWKPSITPNKFNNFSDDELDEFDQLVRGDRYPSRPSSIPKENSIVISDEEFDKSFKSQPDNIRDDDLYVLDSPTPPAESNEFIVQSMDQIYEVRTGKLVSPKPNYENMDSPTRLVHLKKYGLKSLSKRKAVICLEHIYNRLHPFIDLNDRDDLDTLLSQKEMHAIGSSKNRIGDMDTNYRTSEPLVENDFDALQENEDVFFLPSAPRAKKPWCLQPLHVAWHNLINSNPTLYDDLLQYKPVDLMGIRSLLKSIDLRYETNDIISFLDRKCITFKTDNKRSQALKKN